MAWRIAFVLWSGADELGINCYYLVNQKGRAMIAYGDDELYTIRSRIDNYNINKPRGAKDVYTPVKYYRKASFETKLRFTARDYFQLKDILVEMYPYSVSVNKKANRISLQDIVKDELTRLMTDDNSYKTRGYSLNQINWLINEAMAYTKC